MTDTQIKCPIYLTNKEKKVFQKEIKLKFINEMNRYRSLIEILIPSQT